MPTRHGGGDSTQSMRNGGVAEVLTDMALAYTARRTRFVRQRPGGVHCFVYVTSTALVHSMRPDPFEIVHCSVTFALVPAWFHVALPTLRIFPFGSEARSSGHVS